MTTHRIGLWTPTHSGQKDAKTTTTSYVDVASASDLSKKLTELGAKQIALLSRDRAGVTHTEGKKFSPAEVNAEHLAWLTAKTPEFETRGLFYE